MHSFLKISFVVTLLAFGLFGEGCSCKGHPSIDNPGFLLPDGGADGGTDAGSDGGTGTDAGGLACNNTTCAPGQACVYGSCIAPPAGCSSNAQCENDTYCDTTSGSGQCIPYGIGPLDAGFNPSCQRLTALGLFSPRPACQWTGPSAGDPYPNHVNVLSTPLVADFDFDNNPAAIHPSIVFNTYNCTDGASGQEPGCYGVIRVIDGKTCQTQFSIGGSGGDTHIIGSVTPAIGKLDPSLARPDIVVEDREGGVLGFRYTPGAAGAPGSFNLISGWSSAGPNAINWHWDSLSLHDLDNDGIPEIVQTGPHPTIYDNRGNVIFGGTGIDVSYGHELHPVLAPLDDGGVMLADGREVFRFNPSTRQLETLYSSTQSLGQTALADFGTCPETGGGCDRTHLDGIPELVVVSNGSVRVQTLKGNVVFGPLPVFDGGTGGAPTVADFDGDGRAEFGVAGGDAYTVYDPDCVSGSDGGCGSKSNNGILWAQPSQDHSSNVTGSSVFDFDGDGKAEVVYADECFSRVYDGQSGRVLFSQFHTSCTWYENPIVADTAGDFHTKLVIPSNVNCGIQCPSIDPIDPGLSCNTDADCPTLTTCKREQPGDKYGFCRCGQASDCGSPSLTCGNPTKGAYTQGMVCLASHPTGAPQQGIMVMQDVQDRWVPSRTIWNQHAYAVTNVNDDGSIPSTSAWKQNWKDPKLNNFRMNVQGSLGPQSVADLTTPAGTYSCDASGAATLQSRICNRGTGPVGAGDPVTFYAGTPAPGNAICTVRTQNTLNPGDCEAVQCAYTHPSPTSINVSVVADDDGTGSVTTAECEKSNNLGTIPNVNCSSLN